MTTPLYKTIGLMSGTSLDGIDAALIETDGHGYARPLAFYYQAYEDLERAQIRACFGKTDRTLKDVTEAEALLTLKHAEAVKALLKQENLASQDIDLIGFHGQTIYHAPADGLTIQLGDGALLAHETGIDVVYDFRANDVIHGGEGAPLAPIYHQALAKTAGLETPLVILNIGGVANVTYIGADDNLVAFDTGPGNALMDDFVQKHTGARFDKGGVLAAAGTPNDDLLNEWLAHEYFKRIPPKSLDRDEWDVAIFGRLASYEDGEGFENTLATLLHFTAASILKSRDHMPELPKVWYACGGGRHNGALMALLSTEINIKDINDLGWNGDAIEAECFAYLAVRTKLGLPISFPGTTRAQRPLSGGVIVRA